MDIDVYKLHKKSILKTQEKFKQNFSFINIYKIWSLNI